jgi:hypothetical protein
MIQNLSQPHYQYFSQLYYFHIAIPEPEIFSTTDNYELPKTPHSRFEQ